MTLSNQVAALEVSIPYKRVINSQVDELTLYQFSVSIPYKRVINFDYLRLHRGMEVVSIPYKRVINAFDDITLAGWEGFNPL